MCSLQKRKGLQHGHRAAHTKHSFLQDHECTREFHLVALIPKFSNYAGYCNHSYENMPRL
jgi:hypothetical protein